MSNTAPIRLPIPACGILAAESVHDAQFAMAFEAHPFYELYYVHKGKVAYSEQGWAQPLLLSAGMLLGVPMEKPHRIEDQSQATLLLLRLAAAFIDSHPERAKLWERLRRRRHRRLYPDSIQCETIERSLRRIMLEQTVERPGGALAVRAEASQILVSLARLPDAPPQASAAERVAGVLRTLEETFFEPWDLDAAARRAHLSRRRFSELFRELTGVSFLAHLSELRLAHAARLIGERRQSIAGAAFSCGFGDLSHFYRLFKKRFGQSPAKWLRYPK